MLKQQFPEPTVGALIFNQKGELFLMKSYKWKTDKNEHVLDEPVDVNNHLIDAVRYGLNEEIHNQHSEISTLEDIDFLF